MPISSIHSFLVKPLKGQSSAASLGAHIPLSGQPFTMLSSIFESTDQECKIDIRFQATDGNQSNDIRDKLVAYVGDVSKATSIAKAQSLAEYLQLATTKVSGMGLLFFIRGTEQSGRNKLVISRFPADNGIMADDGSGTLSVKFVERIFVKNMQSYKAVAYKNLTPTSNVWKGKAVDRQISDVRNPTSRYWIYDFLKSEFAVTGTLGSERIGDALKKTLSGNVSNDVKAEIMSAATLLKNTSQTPTTARDLLKSLKLSDAAKAAVEANFPSSRSLDETFQFNLTAFSTVFRYRSVVIDKGVMITADAMDFSDKVSSSKVGSETKFEVVGKVVDDRVTKSRAGGAF